MHFHFRRCQTWFHNLGNIKAVFALKFLQNILHDILVGFQFKLVSSLKNSSYYLKKEQAKPYTNDIIKYILPVISDLVQVT